MIGWDASLPNSSRSGQPSRSGHVDEAKTIQVATERALRAAGLRRMAWWRKPMHWGFPQLLRTVDYGYRPARALWVAVLLIGIGWAGIHWGQGALVSAKNPEAGAPATVLVPLAHAVEAFVPQLGQVEAFRPDMATRSAWWLQLLLWVYGFLGWLNPRPGVGWVAWAISQGVTEALGQMAGASGGGAEDFSSRKHLCCACDESATQGVEGCL